MYGDPSGGVVALWARMQTSLHTGPMLRINSPFPPQALLALTPTLECPPHLSEPTHVTYLTGRR